MEGSRCLHASVPWSALWSEMMDQEYNQYSNPECGWIEVWDKINL